MHWFVVLGCSRYDMYGVVLVMKRRVQVEIKAVDGFRLMVSDYAFRSAKKGIVQ